MTRVLAIGGHAHGTTLPLPEHGHVLHTMAPVEWNVTDFTAGEIPSMVMPDVVEYRLVEFGMRWVGRQGQCAEHWRLLVVAGMAEAEAETWVKLVITWYMVWAHITLDGLLSHTLAMDRLATDILLFEEWAGAMRELHRLRAEVWYLSRDLDL